MTAAALTTIPGENGARSHADTGHVPGTVGSDSARFGEVLRRAATITGGAATALPAQPLPGRAQGSPAEDAGPQAQDERKDEAPGADATASHAPLTIDGLNAMLLVGGGRTTAAGAARAELLAPSESGPATAEGNEARAPAASRRAGEHGSSSPGAGETGGDSPREARSDANREPPRAAPDTANRAATQTQQNGSGGADLNARHTAGDRTQAGAASTTDPLRALTARAHAQPGAGVSRPSAPASGVPTNSTLAVRSLGAPGSAQGVQRRAPASQPAPTASAARREALAAQMSRILNTAAAKGGGTMTMRLAPESLGAVTVRVGVEDGVVTARFEAATAAARDLLDASLSALRSSLEAKGLSVDRLQAELAPETSRSAPEDQGGEQAGTEPGLGGSAGDDPAGGRNPADRRAGESGTRDSARRGAEPPGAQAPDDRTEAVEGADFWTEGLYLGLDALA